MDILVSGSMAYDRIMDFPGSFADHILPDKIHTLNVSFTVNGLRENFGGTAGNIAYALALLGQSPTIVATIGCDNARYFDWLKQNIIDLSGITVVDDEFTAGAYITTDQSDNQITGFNPGAMKCRTFYDVDQVDVKNTIAIVAPGNIDDMAAYPQIYREKGIRFIFDPGQSLPMWEGEALAEAIEGAEILITNDYELDLVMKMTELSVDDLLKKVKIVISTRGEEGSRIYSDGNQVEVNSIKAKQVNDPTGAGDAYRAGLIKGLIEGKDIEQCAIMGSACASFAVENYGTQEYSFTIEEFEQRLASYK
ncbi:MAG: carbohydrate kinase family protein [Chloroflexi bacterium]|nr:carbohydrate kinase family protein [Chloroflexota bacterium]MBT7080305.1 carbohydrate kinase family protein [Chloroflexota bacterium]MBT7290000.1 carbohydrate kinase family protein [Chloroflexota bacterium]